MSDEELYDDYYITDNSSLLEISKDAKKYIKDNPDCGVISLYKCDEQQHGRSYREFYTLVKTFRG